MGTRAWHGLPFCPLTRGDASCYALGDALFPSPARQAGHARAARDHDRQRSRRLPSLGETSGPRERLAGRGRSPNRRPRARGGARPGHPGRPGRHERLGERAVSLERADRRPPSGQGNPRQGPPLPGRPRRTARRRPGPMSSARDTARDAIARGARESHRPGRRRRAARAHHGSGQREPRLARERRAGRSYRSTASRSSPSIR
jgi:hypothetical protein